jgi:hypothetical protein
LPSRRLDIELAIGDRVKADAAEPVKSGNIEVIDMHGPWTDPSLRPAAPPVDSAAPQQGPPG